MRFLPAGDDPQVGWPAREPVAVGVLAQLGGELPDAGLGKAAGLAVDVEDGVEGVGGTWLRAARSRSPSSQPML